MRASDHRLLEAVQDGRADAVYAALAGGADVDCQNDFGDTPLIYAAAAGEARIVRQLLDAGARIQQRGRFGTTALHEAVSFECTEAVSLLLNAGAAVDTPTDDGTTPLMLAAGRGDLAIARQLVERGADLAARDARGWTALDFALEKATDDLLQYLESVGAISGFGWKP